MLRLPLALALCLGFNNPSPPVVPFPPLLAGPHYLRDTVPEKVVIRNKKEEKVFLEKHSFAGEPDFPVVDYEKKMVLGVILGPQRTGAIRVEINKIEDLGNKILVSSIRWLPNPKRFVTDDIGYPVSLVLVEQSPKTIEFAPTVDKVRE